MPAYMTVAELSSHFYNENLNQITRNQDSIAEEAIAMAVSEAKGFLNKYDLDKLFGNETTAAVVVDTNLKMKVIDIAAFQLITLANANVDYDKYQARYLMAIDKYFRLIQKGDISPQGWILRDTTDQVAPNGSAVAFSSNPKKTFHV